MSGLYEGRELQTAQWADYRNGTFFVDDRKREIQMVNSDGTGTPLLKSGGLGADIIRFGPNEGVAEHRHVGRHVLFVLHGIGVVKYDGADNGLYPGKSYLVDSWVPHAIYGGEHDPLVLLVVGDDHRGLNDPTRMELTTLGEQERQSDGRLLVYGGDVLNALKASGPVLPAETYRD